MKLHWGWGIGLLYSGFVAMIGVLVFSSLNQHIELVTENYYEEEIQYQQKIDRIKRTNTLAEPLRWNVEGNKLTIQFPASVGKPNGKIRFYCPSNSHNDRVIQITPDQQFAQQIALSRLPAGHYKLQIDWEANELAYWNEGKIDVKGP